MKSFIQGNWKFIAWGLSPLAILAIILALPLKTVPVQVTETYWDTELKKEPYATSENYTEVEPYITTETRTETVYDSYVYPSSWSYTFKVDKANSSVYINGQGYAYYPQYYVIYPDSESPVYRFWPYYWGGDGQSKVTITVTYPEEVTKHRTVTKYRDAIKYREVSSPVQKERTSTKYVKISIWGYLFR